MKKIAIVTDSNSGITMEEAAKLGIEMIPMPFFVDGEEHMEGVSCTGDEFFEKLGSGSEVSTSQPSPGSLEDVWNQVLEKYESLVYIPMSSGLSGSCQAAKALAMDYEDKVFVVDNKRISLTQKQSVFDAIKLADYGLSGEEIRDVLEREALQASIYVTVNTLDLLKKSGRVTKAAAALATVLNLKPVLQIQGDKLDAFKKARGMDKARVMMLDAIKNDIETRFKDEKYKIAVAYSGSKEDGESWRAECAEYFGNPDIEMDMLPISICCHVGAGALGIAVIKTL